MGWVPSRSDGASPLGIRLEEEGLMSTGHHRGRQIESRIGDRGDALDVEDVDASSWWHALEERRHTGHVVLRNPTGELGSILDGRLIHDDLTMESEA